jgi:hypothetical protein
MKHFFTSHNISKYSKYARYQKYFFIFDIDSLLDFLFNVELILMNPDFDTQSNLDDYEFMELLLFSSRFGKIHISFYEFIFNKVVSNVYKSEIINKYIPIILDFSPLYVYELYDTILYQDNEFFQTLIKGMEDSIRNDFIFYALKRAQENPKLMDRYPCLQTYKVFI